MSRRRSAAALAEAAGGTPERAQLRAVDGRHTLTRTRSAKLSEKELVVLHELARGRQTEEIGAALSLSPHTVRTHIKNAMRKLGARTRAHAVAIALRDGVIRLDA